MATGFSNAAEMLDTLGGVPPERIRMTPPPGLATLDDAIAADRMSEPICELVDGVLIEKAMGYQESLIAAMLIRLIGQYLDKNDLGVCAGADGISQYYEGCVRAPDVSFVRWERLPDRRVPTAPIPDLTPNLAVEILSRSNTKREMDRKVADFKAGGVKVIWIIDPREETVTLFVGDAEPVVIDANAKLDAGDVLPGFELTLRQLLDRAGIRKP